MVNDIILTKHTDLGRKSSPRIALDERNMIRRFAHFLSLLGIREAHNLL